MRETRRDCLCMCMRTDKNIKNIMRLRGFVTFVCVCLDKIEKYKSCVFWIDCRCAHNFTLN